MRSTKKIIASIIASVGLVAGLALGSAAPAQAASCYEMASYGISICGSWNGNSTSYAGYDYAQTTGWSWTVTKPDPQVAVTSIVVTIAGRSACRAVPNWGACSTFYTNQTWARSLGGSTMHPSYTGLWGLVTGSAEYQSSHVTVRWCRAGTCYTQQTGNITVGSIG